MKEGDREAEGAGLCGHSKGPPSIVIQLKDSGTAFLHTSPSGGGGEGAYKSGEQNAENGKTCTLAYSRGAHREAREAWEARKLQGVGVGVGHKYRVDRGTLYWRKKG